MNILAKCGSEPNMLCLALIWSPILFWCHLISHCELQLLTTRIGYALMHGLVNFIWDHACYFRTLKLILCPHLMANEVMILIWGTNCDASLIHWHNYLSEIWQMAILNASRMKPSRLLKLFSPWTLALPLQEADLVGFRNPEVCRRQLPKRQMDFRHYLASSFDTLRSHEFRW